VMGCCAYGNESSGFIKERGVLGHIRGNRFLKKFSDPWSWLHPFGLFCYAASG
jgi:hypothetical protein